ncbi:MAG: toxin-antitoxin system YwqK family antitoxin [Verrucomicrobia bacterium]|nr:toxin-antitoxin system YwqK family antitoxin [Verrucomicrobiota bacterium]
MNKFFFSLPIAVGLVLAGCGSDNGGSQVISKRYIHKYGYAVSDSEWAANNYPGQVITTLRNGVTITATYEDGHLHGPTTHTHPHSQTVQYYYLYNDGELKKEVVYDSLGMPIQEKVQLSPHRHCVTTWFGDGTPKSIEDYAGEELLDGQYFSLNNELESRVERGIGLRTLRDVNGLLLAKDEIDKGYVTKKEEFYATGAPHRITNYLMNAKHGERRAFTENGDPLSVEEWVDDQLHGKATYYTNGKKQIEVYFVHGARNGIETHYIDGELVEQEIQWVHDKRHGPTKFFVGNAVAKTEWYYNGQGVSQKRFDELFQMDQMITQASAIPGETPSKN